MTRLSVVEGDKGLVTMTFGEACRATLERLLATGATTLVFVAGSDTLTQWASVPSSEMLEKGAALVLSEELIRRAISE